MLSSGRELLVNGRAKSSQVGCVSCSVDDIAAGGRKAESALYSAETSCAELCACSYPCRGCRVHTMSVPAVAELHQLYEVADEGAIVTLLAKLAVEKSYVAKLDDTRQVCSGSVTRLCVGFADSG